MESEDKIDDLIEEARRARREAAREARPEIAAVHSDYIDKLTSLKVEWTKLCEHAAALEKVRRR